VTAWLAVVWASGRLSANGLPQLGASGDRCSFRGGCDASTCYRAARIMACLACSTSLTTLDGSILAADSSYCAVGNLGVYPPLGPGGAPVGRRWAMSQAVRRSSVLHSWCPCPMLQVVASSACSPSHA